MNNISQYTMFLAHFNIQKLHSHLIQARFLTGKIC